MEKFYKNILLSISTALLIVLLNGCVSDTEGPNDGESATYALCKYWWRADYIDFDDAKIKQEFTFNTDGTGSELISRDSGMGTSTSDEYFFRWSWDSSSHRVVRLDYESNGVGFLHDIFIVDDVMTCRISGDNVTFYGLNRNGDFQ